jgi:hypothetical protein
VFFRIWARILFRVLTLVLAPALTLQTACTSNPPVRIEQSEKLRPRQEFADALGRHPEIDASADEDPSPAPYRDCPALGAGDRLAAVTSYCDYPPAARVRRSAILSSQTSSGLSHSNPTSCSFRHQVSSNNLQIASTSFDTGLRDIPERYTM